MLPMIKTQDGLIVLLAGKPVAISAASPVFDAVCTAVAAGDASQLTELLETAKRLLKSANSIPGTNVRITDDGAVYYNDDAVHGMLVDRMVEMLEKGFDLTPMARFLHNLKQNPSYRAVQELYPFLEKGGCPITEDGHFLAYKAVRADFLDIHSGTFDNSVGARPSMPRNGVDEDSSRTCSAGLHVCSYAYLPHFARADGHIVLVKVNPQDVVAIPLDYNNTKMRVSCYEVIAVVDYTYPDGDVFADRLVVSEGPYVVESYDSEGYREERVDCDSLNDALAVIQDMDHELERVILATDPVRELLRVAAEPDDEDNDGYGD